MSYARPDDRSLFQALIDDGRPLLFVLATGLFACGSGALFLAATGSFLPHDEHFLGMTARQLCGFDACRVVHFMIHDRASFGGVLVAEGLIYFWLAEFPLRAGVEWSWWTFLFSGIVGFVSFLAYLGFGYLDAWHAAATLTLLPCFVFGLGRSQLSPRAGIRCLLDGSAWSHCGYVVRIGRASLLIAALGIVGSGFTILVLGSSVVFVPQDLEFLGVRPEHLQALNPRLIPLIAHDRAGFGGALASCGIALFLCIWCGQPSRSLWQVLALAGVAGFAPAILVHPIIGYNDAVHLAPAVCGAILYTVGIALTHPRLIRSTRRNTVGAPGSEWVLSQSARKRSYAQGRQGCGSNTSNRTRHEASGTK
jgi:hypothetical protein